MFKEPVFDEKHNFMLFYKRKINGTNRLFRDTLIAIIIFSIHLQNAPAEREKARHNLLKYCELDTFAMVKVWQELVKVAEWKIISLF